MSRRAVFLDRDGTIIEDAGYLSDARDVRLLPGALDALGALRNAGFALVLVSNQSGVGRGLISPTQLAEVHRRLEDELASGSVTLDSALYCTHKPTDGCDCRKPAPGMILEAASQIGIEISASYLVGDRETDVLAGVAAGCRPILLGPDDPRSAASYCAPDLLAAAEHILSTCGDTGGPQEERGHV